MKSSYKKIGDQITLIDERNLGLKIKNLLGLSISKEFIPSVANTIGTDMENYKIIKKNQFACSVMQVRRDKKMPVALLKDAEQAIVSQAYPIFEVNDTSVLLPEYLMMWFSRSEFDREACFHAIGGVRGSLEWEDFCNMSLPIPAVSKQEEIVKEFKVIENRIVLNESLIAKLEDAAHSIYKQWFIEFDFPNKDGAPYKSSGGEMVWNEQLEKDVPKNWEVGSLNNLMLSTLGGDWGKDTEFGNYTKEVYCLRGTDIPGAAHGKKGNAPIRFLLPKNLESRKLEAFDIVLEISGGSPTQSTGRSVFVSNQYLKYLNKPVICSNFCRVIKAKSGYAEYLYAVIKYLYNVGILFKYENSSNGVKNLALDDVLKEEIAPVPNIEVLNSFRAIYLVLASQIQLLGMELEKINELRDLMLSRMATIKH